MASKLVRLRDRLVAVLGRPDPHLADAVFVLEHRSTVLLPLAIDADRRRHVARMAQRGIAGGWAPGDGVPGLRRALARCVELGDHDPDVHADLKVLFDDLAGELEALPHPFD